MGNTSSGVTSGGKSQAEASQALYKLADLGGGGKLIPILHKAIASGDFTTLDATIRKEIPPFLYNNGEGAMISINEIVAVRHRERTGQAFQKPKKKPTWMGVLRKRVLDKFAKKELDGRPKVERLEPRKMTCWLLSERGGVGETLVHVCFLCGSAHHMVLARHLLSIFPKLVCDIYVSDEYFGENVLHMAIVNEDVIIVKYLIEQGAELHQRACGNFFTPDDQKLSKRDVWDQEEVGLVLKSKFAGHMYWGEYPLSFAACLGQDFVYRILTSKGADANAQDSNGNTVLHIMVIRNDPEMFDLATSTGANSEIKNRQGLTPLALAAYLPSVNMFSHILAFSREPYWEYGDVFCAAYPLPNVDTIDHTSGMLNPNSVLAHLVYGDSSLHLECFNFFVAELCQRKWDVFAKKRLFTQLGKFVAYYALMFLSFYWRPSPNVGATFPLELRTNTTGHGVVCFLRPSFKEEPGRLISETLVVLACVAYLASAVQDYRYVGRRLFKQGLLGFPAAAAFLVSCTLVCYFVSLAVFI